MSKEKFWELVEKTGRLEAYLLYKFETAKEIAPEEMGSGEKRLKQVNENGEKCKRTRA